MRVACTMPSPSNLVERSRQGKCRGLVKGQGCNLGVRLCYELSPVPPAHPFRDNAWPAVCCAAAHCAVLCCAAWCVRCVPVVACVGVVEGVAAIPQEHSIELRGQLTRHHLTLGLKHLRLHNGVTVSNTHLSLYRNKLLSTLCYDA